MRSFVGLLRREWQEHKSAFIWGPGCVLIVLVLAGIMATAINPYVEADFDSSEAIEINERLSEERRDRAGMMEMLAAMVFDVAGSTDAELEDKMSGLLRGVVVPFHLVYLAIGFFALLACLYDERKDQSILFWKSLPVSDTATVMSKLIFVIWVAPLVTIAAVIMAQFLIVTVSSIFVEDGMSGRIWAASQIWWRPLELLVGYFMLGVWALPLMGWVLVVSAWANKLPVLWVIGVPWVVGLLERIIIGTEKFSEIVTGHFALLMSLPRDTQVSVFGMFTMFSETRFWLGLMVGALLIATAIVLRSRVNDAH